MYCSFCGKEIPDESTFCGYCGKKLVYIGDRPDFEEDGWMPEDGEGAPYFVAPHWNFYGAATLWDEEDAEEGRPEEEAEPEGATSEEATSDDAASDADADAEDAAGEADAAAAEADAEAEKSEEGDDAEETTEDDADDEAFEEDVFEADLGPGPVLPATQPLSKEAFRNAASSGVYVPARAGSAQNGKGRVAAPAVVGIAVAALLVGAVGAFTLADPLMESLGLKQAPAAEAPADNASEQDGAAGDGAADETPAADENAVDGTAEGDQGEAPEQEPAVETGFGSAKKLVAALETPLFDALGENFSHTSMRLLAIDELDFMVPAYAEALAREAGYATVSDYARNVEDGDASQFGNYAGTWSFKLERGKKCSARAIERMERQYQLAGLDLTITKAYKIEAVTANYPADYQSENVDDEGHYHKVTPYTAVQVDGRWYLYTDALVPVDSEKEE